MPRLKHSLPTPRLHKPSGLARVRIERREFWLGRFGSKEAQDAYDALIARYLDAGRKAPTPEPTRPARSPSVAVDPNAVTVSMLIDRFWTWAERHYRAPDGQPTREAENFRAILRLLRKRYGALPVAAFGSDKLFAIQDELVAKSDLARTTINAMIRRARTIFSWGVPRKIVPAAVAAELADVKPLGKGRGGRETPGYRTAVPWPLVEATLPSLSPMLQAFVRVLYHTGARQSEAARLTTGMIDRTREVWTVDLDRHKNAHKDKRRRLYFGPQAQTAITPWLLPDEPDAPIFSPRRVDDRQSKRRGKRRPGLYYSRPSLDQTLRRAVARAGVERWTLAQLRNAAADRLTDDGGEEAARQALGHASLRMTRHYAREAESRALEAIGRIG